MPLPHPSAKENASGDVAMLCMPQQGNEARGMPVLSVHCLLLTLNQDVPSVCQWLWVRLAKASQ